MTSKQALNQNTKGAHLWKPEHGIPKIETLQLIPPTSERVVGYYNREGEVRFWNGTVLKCMHHRNPSACVYCPAEKAKGLCIHRRQKYHCRECDGGMFCEHKVRKNICVDCGGSRLCIHRIDRDNCKPCKGKNICEHDNFKHTCTKCKGTAICNHGKKKKHCEECGGWELCEHKRKKQYCRECDGIMICVHDRIRNSCRDCNGSAFCKAHNHRKDTCADCFTHPHNFCTECKKTLIKTSPYKPYCYPCHEKLFPDATRRPSRRMIKQRRIERFLKEMLPHEEIICDRPIQPTKGKSSGRRPDWLIRTPTHVVIIECDEDAHRNMGYNHVNYDNEEDRMADIHQDLNGPDVYFIRFNPDDYEGKSCFTFEDEESNELTTHPVWEIRSQELLRVILKCLEEPPSDMIEVIKLFY